jgi:hypothetical protein
MIIKFKQMKKIVLFLTLLVFFSGAFSQENLVLNTACGGEQQTYVYKELYEGRASYVIGAEACTQLSSESRCVNDFTSYYIRWSGSQWEWVEVVRSGTSCVWLVQICVPLFSDENGDVIPPVILSETVLATNSANTPIPPRYGWVVSDGNCMPTIISGYADPEPVVLNTSCGQSQRTYEYTGSFNGKPKYEITLVDCESIFEETDCNQYINQTNKFEIVWNGTYWEWNAINEGYGCVWLFTSCVDTDGGTTERVTLARNYTNTTYPPHLDWEELNENCMPNIISGYSSNIIDQALTSCSPTKLISLNSQTDVTYTLLNEDDDVVDGPVAGTGAEITLNTGAVVGSQTFKVRVVSTSDPDNCNLLLTQQVTKITSFTGSGTALDPFEITSLNDLQILSENSCLWDKHFIQTADINASPTNTWNSGAGFIPIGNNITASFQGSYNGQGYEIDGLTINRPTEDYIGLFGNNSGALQKIHLVAANVTGQYRVGAVVGYNVGSLDECISFGSVTGIANVGGLSGENDGGIANCYSGASVDGTERIGGFIGYNGHSGGEITNCYSFGSVTGDYELGGFCSDNDGDIFYCFYDQTASGQSDTGKGERKSEEDLQNQSTFSNAPANWDFTTIWKMGLCTNNGYPVLAWQTIQERPTVSDPLSDSRCGTGELTISAAPSTGSIKWFTASSGGTAIVDDADYDLSGNDLTINNLASTTTFYAEATNGNCVSVGRTAVVATVELTTQVQASQQGSTLPFLGSNSFTGTPIIADAVLGATRYRFEVTEGGNTVFLTRNGRWFYLSNLPSYDYGKTYSIRVCVELGGDFGCYGNSYDVSSPLLPPTSQVIAEQRGTTMASMYNWIKAEERVGATNYRFRVTFNSATEVIETTNRYFYLSQLNNATYDTEYEIEVAVEHPNIPGFGDYGTPYSVFSPAITQVQSSQCSITLDNNSTAIIADAVQGATGYRFEVTQNGSTEVLTRSSRWFYLANLTSYLPNRIMKVRVSVQKGGVWGPYWTSCYITTPASGMIKNPNEDKLDKFTTVELNTYPNPNNGDFTISSSHEGTFNIINELGQLVKSIEITKENNYQMHVDGLRNGIYFITGTINDEVITNKIVVH